MLLVGIFAAMRMRSGSPPPVSEPAVTHAPASEGAPARAAPASADRLRATLGDALRASAAAPDTLVAQADRLAPVLAASLTHDFHALERGAHSLGGGFRGQIAEYDQMRRVLRSWPVTSRPPGARKLSQAEWEAWVDRAGRAELLNLPGDPVRGPVREALPDSIEIVEVRGLSHPEVARLEDILRRNARERGLRVNDNTRVMRSQGRLRYRPEALGEAPPETLIGVLLQGVSTDDRDFVALYILGYEPAVGWFPFWLMSVSAHRETTPQDRRAPFIPAF